MSKNRLVLAGDVGGTKTYLGLFEINPPSPPFKKGGNRPRELKVNRFVNADFKTIGSVVASFLAQTGAVKDICSAVIGVACPVENNRGHLTNISWRVDGRALGKRFGIKKFELINDLVALGRGAGLLSGNDISVLRKGRAKPANAALIAAGTGLGEAILFRSSGTLIPSASEGGHADFAPQSAVEMELHRYLARKYGHVSCERIVSGPGLHELYRFFRARSGGKETKRLAERFALEKDGAAVVFDEAVRRTDGNCVKAYKLFISVYGAEAGNLALKAMATGGVYLGGGIAPKVFADRAAASIFLKSFSAKGRFKKLLDAIPVYVIQNEKAALLGAAFHAHSLMKGQPPASDTRGQA